MDMVLLHTGPCLVHLDCQNVVRPTRTICGMEAERPMATFCPGMPLVGLTNFLVRSDNLQSEKSFATMCHVAGADGQLGGHARPTCRSSSVGRMHNQMQRNISF